MEYMKERIGEAVVILALGAVVIALILTLAYVARNSEKQDIDAASKGIVYDRNVRVYVPVK